MYEIKQTAFMEICKMKIEERCLYQIFEAKPKLKNGNCDVCSYDENNKYCINYYPINILVIELKGGGK